MTHINQTKENMEKAIEHFKKELGGVRTGRANPSILENVQVDVYGSKMRVKDLATISNPEPRQLLVTPFDPNTAAEIAKGIDKAELGFQVIHDGHLVRIMAPEMSEAVRKDMVKLCKKRCEEGKIGIRNVRKDTNDKIKKDKTGGELTEDEVKGLEKEVQELTDKFCAEIDRLCGEKEKEVMQV